MTERDKVKATRGLEELKKLLGEQTQKELAEKLGMPQSVISEIVNQWRLPTLEQAILLKAHGIDPESWSTKESAA